MIDKNRFLLVICDKIIFSDAIEVYAGPIGFSAQFTMYFWATLQTRHSVTCKDFAFILPHAEKPLLVL